MSRGTLVNKEITSKLSMWSKGSLTSFFMNSKKSVVFLIWASDTKPTWEPRTLTKYKERFLFGAFMLDTIGRRGQFPLCIFGRP